MKNKINTGHKAFDKQTNCIAIGNVSANTQLSGFVRSKNEVECNNHSYAPGELQDYDLNKGYISQFFPSYLRYIARDLADKHNGCIVYKFFHKTGKDCMGTTHYQHHGFVITSRDCKLLWQKVEPMSWKSPLVMNEVIKHITFNN